jgi:hypothetical protein
MGPDVAYQVQTDDRPFDGVSADTKDGECAVWVTFGSTKEDHLAHGIQNVSASRVRRLRNQGLRWKLCPRHDDNCTGIEPAGNVSNSRRHC